MLCGLEETKLSSNAFLVCLAGGGSVVVCRVRIAVPAVGIEARVDVGKATVCQQLLLLDPAIVCGEIQRSKFHVKIDPKMDISIWGSLGPCKRTRAVDGPGNNGLQRPS